MITLLNLILWITIALIVVILFIACFYEIAEMCGGQGRTDERRR